MTNDHRVIIILFRCVTLVFQTRIQHVGPYVRKYINRQLLTTAQCALSVDNASNNHKNG